MVNKSNVFSVVSVLMMTISATAASSIDGYFVHMEKKNTCAAYQRRQASLKVEFGQASQVVMDSSRELLMLKVQMDSLNKPLQSQIDILSKRASDIKMQIGSLVAELQKLQPSYVYGQSSSLVKQSSSDVNISVEEKIKSLKASIDKLNSDLKDQWVKISLLQQQMGSQDKDLSLAILEVQSRLSYFQSRVDSSKNELGYVESILAKVCQ